MAHGLLYGASFTNGVLSFTDKQGRTICNADLRNYLTLTATEDNSSVALTKVGTLSNEFEVNVGNGWEDYTFGTVIPLNSGESCKWRCKSHPTTQSLSDYVKFVMTGMIEASGNCNSMLNSDFEGITSLYGYDCAFCWLFRDCTSLTKAPNLPSTTLGDSCYTYMFLRCTSLTQAPVLPATTLAEHCYWYMFSGCKSLTKAPVLPATTLAEYCYASMFKDCTSLTQAPVLQATTTKTACYQYMFAGCTSLTKAPALPATTLAEGCYGSMFSDCTSLTEAPALPATTLAEYCYHTMFNGCKSLTKAPVLPATTLASNCYSDMFYDCSSLNEVRCHMPSSYSASDIPSNYTYSWLLNVASTGTFYTNADANWTSGVSGIPKGWTRLPL